MTNVDRKQQEDRSEQEFASATFEEKYGPWICMGCGMAHKLGEECVEGPR
jgi:hypothetical protein